MPRRDARRRHRCGTSRSPAAETAAATRTTMPVSSHDDPPILVCADLQVEHLTQGRDNLWPVMHLKRIAQAAWFNPASRLTDWIAEAKPRPGEMTFEHPLPSAYSSSRFADYMSSIRDIRCVLTGFSLDETILATVVEGFHRSHRYQVVGDAVACRQPGTGEAAAYKQSVVNIIGNFATIRSSAELIRTSGAVAV